VSAARRRSEAAVRSARDELDRRVQERTEELQRSILEKEQATQELNLAQERLSDLARTLSMAEMAAAIAHQLNQPLTALTTEAHACRRWLQSQPPNVDRATMTAERMVRETARASAVVDRVRSLFSRSDYRREATDLNRLIGDLARVLRDEANRHKVSIQLQLSDGIPLVMVDPVQIQQVILNLVMNAMEAIGENAAVRNVEISTELAGDEVRVSVQDHGGGIPETVKDRIFEPFFTTKEKGTGMGLAICRTIMEEHDGRIWAESLESGTAIRFALKVKQA
jgi:C4-dicarboxylate-specific signal transduction histidine kinase